MPVTIYYLETDGQRFRPVTRTIQGVSIEQVSMPSPELNRDFYARVGRDWQWTDRLSWTSNDWRHYVNRPTLETWIGFRDGSPFGYYELELELPEQVQIAYFGLLPDFIGQGLGGLLLTHAAQRGFDLGTERVWVHTCSLDHPGALPNYLARGFSEYKRETHDG